MRRPRVSPEPSPAPKASRSGPPRATSWAVFFSPLESNEDFFFFPGSVAGIVEAPNGESPATRDFDRSKDLPGKTVRFGRFFNFRSARDDRMMIVRSPVFSILFLLALLL